MREEGLLIIKLDVDRQLVQNVRITIPILEIDQPLAKISRLENLPAGVYEGTITTQLVTGEEITQNVRIEILSGRENVQQIRLPGAGGTITRREPRIPKSVPVDYRTQDGFWISTESINISPTGLCLVKVQTDLEARDVLVRMFAPIPISPLECPGRVRWTRDKNGQPRMGLELFLTSTMQNTLTNWLENTSIS